MKQLELMSDIWEEIDLKGKTLTFKGYLTFIKNT